MVLVQLFKSIAKVQTLIQLSKLYLYKLHADEVIYIRKVVFYKTKHRKQERSCTFTFPPYLPHNQVKVLRFHNFHTILWLKVPNET